MQINQRLLRTAAAFGRLSASRANSHILTPGYLPAPTLGKRIVIHAKIFPRIATLPIAMRFIPVHQALEAFAQYSPLGKKAAVFKAAGRDVYTQQIQFDRGKIKGTFASIIGPTKEEARAAGIQNYYFHELVRNIIGNGSWIKLLFANTLMDMRNPASPKVYVTDPKSILKKNDELVEETDPQMCNGMRLYRDKTLESMLIHGALKRIRNYSDHVDIKRAARESNYNTLSQIDFFSGKVVKESTDTIACRQIKGKYVAVTGFISSSEANSLLAELAEESKFSANICKMGHVLLQFKKGVDTPDIEMEYTESKKGPHFDDMNKWICGFVSGFNEITYISDLHLVSKQADDNFTQAGKTEKIAQKEKHFLELLDKIIASRGTLVINGDFLDLWKEKYGNIRSSYSAVFKRMQGVRKIIYIGGNHDEAVLNERKSASYLKGLENAQNNSVKGCIEFDAASNSFVIRNTTSPEYTQLAKLLEDPACAEMKTALLNVASKRFSKASTNLPGRNMRFIISSGFADEGVLQDNENPVFYIDESLVSGNRKNPAANIYKEINGSMNSLQDVILRDFPNMEIVPNYFFWRRGLVWVEHGHVSDKHNEGLTHTGNTVTGTLGRMERYILRGLTPRTFEQDLEMGGVLAQLSFPHIFWNPLRSVERACGVTGMLDWYMRAKTGTSNLEEESKGTFLQGHDHDDPYDANKFWPLKVLTGWGFLDTATWSGYKPLTQEVPPSTWMNRSIVRIKDVLSPAYSPREFVTMTRNNLDFTMFDRGRKIGDSTNYPKQKIHIDTITSLTE